MIARFIAGVISLSLTAVLIGIISHFEKQKPKHAVNGVKSEHKLKDTNLLELEDGNVLILGEQKYICTPIILKEQPKTTEKAH